MIILNDVIFIMQTNYVYGKVLQFLAHFSTFVGLAESKYTGPITRSARAAWKLFPAVSREKRPFIHLLKYI